MSHIILYLKLYYYHGGPRIRLRWREARRFARCARGEESKYVYIYIYIYIYVYALRERERDSARVRAIAGNALR